VKQAVSLFANMKLFKLFSLPKNSLNVGRLKDLSNFISVMNKLYNFFDDISIAILSIVDEKDRDIKSEGS
jgi:replication fork clamp-binding protein CrfC